VGKGASLDASTNDEMETRRAYACGMAQKGRVGTARSNRIIRR